MTYITFGAARRAAYQSGMTSRGIAESELKKAASAPMSTEYDIFLSHSCWTPTSSPE